MSKKPLMKDCNAYFGNPENWDDLWIDHDTGLRIQKLVNVECLRLCLKDHLINEYVFKSLDPLLYFPGISDIRNIRNCFERTNLTNEEIKNLFRYHWEEEQ